MKTKQIIPTEYQEACTFVDWLELQKQMGKVLDYCHIANESYGGTRADMLRGQKLKRQGRKRGVFDYQVFVQEKIVRDLGKVKICAAPKMVCVELKKRKGGTVSPEQKHWAEVYDKCGIPAKICRGAEEAIEFVKGFLQ